ncbi:MAG: PadR family transcriptional regulator [Chloroflexi bacterium]|nr:PadR family transcriptional regulator [Chloroflexota bacterium]
MMPKENSPSPLPALLGLLMAGPKHPYELYQDFERELGRVWHIGQSHFYAYLKQLAANGMVVVRVEPQPNRPARHIYHLMPAGEAEFLTWLHQPTQRVRHIRLEFLSRLYFYRRMKLPGLAQVVAGAEGPAVYTAGGGRKRHGRFRGRILVSGPRLPAERNGSRDHVVGSLPPGRC